MIEKIIKNTDIAKTIKNVPESENKNSVTFDDLDHIISSKKWNYLVEAQSKLNEIAVTGWKDQDLDWDMAIMDEAMEVFNSKNWKWWKDTDKNNVDWDNLEVEMIDIFHFLLSKSIKEDNANMIYMAMATAENDKEAKTLDKFFENFWDQFLMACVIHSTPIQIVAWTEAWYKIGSFDKLFSGYIIKGALNKIRLEYGYKEGTYKKIWNGLEDNDAVRPLFKDYDFDIDAHDPIELAYDIIEDYYLSNIA